MAAKSSGKTFSNPLTFRAKYILLCILLSLIILSFVVLSSVNIYKQYLANAKDILRFTSQQVTAEVERLIRTLDTFTAAQYTSEPIARIISTPLLSERQKLISQLNESVPSDSGEYGYIPQNLTGLISSYFFVDAEHYYIFPFSFVDNRVKENQEIYEASVQASRSSPLFFPPSLSSSYFFYVRNVDNLPTLKTKGTIVQCITTTELTSLAQNVAEGINVCITDSNGVTYVGENWRQVGSTHPMIERYIAQKERAHEVTNDEDNKLYLIDEAVSGRLLVICSCSTDTILRQVLGQMLPFIVIAFIFIGVMSIIIWVVMTNIVRVLNRLLQRIEQMREGDYSVRMPQYNDRDFAAISDGFNGMAEKIQYMFTVVYKEEALRKESELKFLQAQINPHFLFNTLTTIRIRAKLNGDDITYKMLYSLGELIHAGIVRDDHSLIRLREEIYYVEQYLYLQSMRYGDKLTYAINVDDPSSLECRIPRLCIESIVENGIIYGLEHKVGAGTLTVNIRRADHILKIEIIDDGVGFDVNKLSEHTQGMHSGIGLKNANQRIKLIFGEEYGLDIYSEIDKGTRVCVRIPMKKEDNGV